MAFITSVPTTSRPLTMWCCQDAHCSSDLPKRRSQKSPIWFVSRSRCFLTKTRRNKRKMLHRIQCRIPKSKKQLLRPSEHFSSPGGRVAIAQSTLLHFCQKNVYQSVGACQISFLSFKTCAKGPKIYSLKKRRATWFKNKTSPKKKTGMLCTANCS